VHPLPPKNIMANRVIYLLIALSMGIPLLYGFKLPPAKMQSAEDSYNTVEQLSLKQGQIALVAMDWGPSNLSENLPQTEVIIEHLFRKRIPFAVVSIYQYAVPFLESVPHEVAARLKKENPTEEFVYGRDWVNLGYQPGSSIFIQSIAKASDLHSVFRTDAQGTLIANISMMKNVHTISDIALLAEYTGLVGAFNTWIQFFVSGERSVPFVHGCTSITIPEAYIYYVSKQILGLQEGIAGAAYYEYLLDKNYPTRRASSALKINSALSIAQIVILVLIGVGNVSLMCRRSRS